MITEASKEQTGKYIFPLSTLLTHTSMCFIATKKSLNFEVVEHLEPARDGEAAKYSSIRTSM